MTDGHEEALLGTLQPSMQAAIAGAIGLLPERERLVFTLCWYEELTMMEIGDVLEESESQIRELHRSALASIRISLAAE
jgi:RNA polymerase sigma factor FliA